jgi:hypothetical protein
MLLTLYRYLPVVGGRLTECGADGIRQVLKYGTGRLNIMPLVRVIVLIPHVGKNGSGGLMRVVTDGADGSDGCRLHLTNFLFRALGALWGAKRMRRSLRSSLPLYFFPLKNRNYASVPSGPSEFFLLLLLLSSKN